MENFMNREQRRSGISFKKLQEMMAHTDQWKSIPETGGSHAVDGHSMNGIPSVPVSHETFMQDLFEHTYFPSETSVRDGMKGALIKGMTFNKVNLADISRKWSGVMFENCVFNGCTFEGLDMKGSKWSDCVVNRCLFTQEKPFVEPSSDHQQSRHGEQKSRESIEKTDLSKCDISDSHFMNTVFSDCAMSSMRVNNTWFISTDMIRNDISSMRCDRTMFLNVFMNDNNMSGVQMQSVLMEDTDMVHNSMNGSFMSDCRLANTSIADSNISGMGFKDTSMLMTVFESNVSRSIVFSGVEAKRLLMKNMSNANILLENENRSSFKYVISEGNTSIKFDGMSSPKLVESFENEIRLSDQRQIQKFQISDEQGKNRDQNERTQDAEGWLLQR